MGYYTYYTIDIVKDPENQLEEFKAEFNEIIQEDWYEGFEAKWYDWENDMINMSKKFPKMLIKVTGHGEEALDIWICHFCNGNSNYREIQTYWEDFDENTFYKEYSK